MHLSVLNTLQIALGLVVVLGYLNYSTLFTKLGDIVYSLIHITIICLENFVAYYYYLYGVTEGTVPPVGGVVIHSSDGRISEGFPSEGIRCACSVCAVAV